MSKLGIDYAWARPGGANIVAAGYRFVCRYLSYDAGKTINAGELGDLRSHGLDVVFVWESTGTDAVNGTQAGVSDAKAALGEANSLGVPGDIPIYFAVDFDEAPSQNVALFNYFQGILTVIPKARVGVYGGYWVVSRVMNNGLATYGWQTLAWSGGQVFSGAHIYQNGQMVFAGGADVNVALQDNIGAWTTGVSPAPVNAPVAQVAVASNGNSITVKSGDTLSGIAAAHGLTLGQIESLNPQIANPNVIYPGQVINIGGTGTVPVAAPAPTSSGAKYTVQSGDTLSGIAARYGLSLSQIESLNPQISNPNIIFPGEVVNVIGSAPAPAPAPAAPQVQTYTVQRGDTLGAIAARYGTSWQHLQAVNGIANANLIYPGQVLKIN